MVDAHGILCSAVHNAVLLVTTRQIPSSNYLCCRPTWQTMERRVGESAGEAPRSQLAIIATEKTLSIEDEMVTSRLKRESQEEPLGGGELRVYMY